MRKEDKRKIAEYLIKAIETCVAVDARTCTFIGNWICNGPEEKNSDMKDVWDIVQKNYYQRKDQCCLEQ